MKVRWIDREEPLRSACRHCREPRYNFWQLWAVFFERRFFSMFLVEEGFEHISCDRFWFVSQPYLSRKRAEETYLVERALEGGASVYGVEPGYHDEGTVALIVVPSNKDSFASAINKVLDEHDKYSLWRRCAAGKSAVRRWVHAYLPPREEDCLKKALDYLTWRDAIKEVSAKRFS
jgi:hypothetical protein